MNIYDLYEKVGKRKKRNRSFHGNMPHIIKFFESLFLVPNENKENAIGDFSNFRLDNVRKGVELLLKYKNYDRFFIYGKDYKKALDIAKESFSFIDEFNYDGGFSMFYKYGSGEINNYFNKIKFLDVTLYKIGRALSIFNAGLVGHNGFLYIYNLGPHFPKEYDPFYYMNYAKIRYRHSIEGIYSLWGLVDITIKEAFLARFIIEFKGYEYFILDNINEKLIVDMVINRKVGNRFYGDPIPNNRIFEQVIEQMSLEDALKLSFKELSEKTDLKLKA